MQNIPPLSYGTKGNGGLRAGGAQTRIYNAIYVTSFCKIFLCGGKKGWGLRPCIDYHGLNRITVKYPYSLHLVSSALELLRSAWIFSKLDLRSTNNLIRLQQNDEWKTASSTTTGHYMHQVMSQGPSSVFQCFINDMLRDFLGKFVVDYIEDILIYSPDEQSHVSHVLMYTRTSYMSKTRNESFMWQLRFSVTSLERRV